MKLSMRRSVFRWSLLCTICLLGGLAYAAEEAIRVVVIVILASEKHEEVNAKIKPITDEIQKKNPKLTGFRLFRTLSASIERGKSEKFKLPADSEMEVSVHAQLDENGCVTLTIKPPTLGEITYHCKCDRFFPVITGFQPDKTTDEKMILAIMATPCKKK